MKFYVLEKLGLFFVCFIALIIVSVAIFYFNPIENYKTKNTNAILKKISVGDTIYFEYGSRINMFIVSKNDTANLVFIGEYKNLWRKWDNNIYILSYVEYRKKGTKFTQGYYR